MVQPISKNGFNIRAVLFGKAVNPKNGFFYALLDI